ncbi:MAG: hypothetical protein E6767_04765 [Dysgonomonas sp.]|nr:hypothetical protein [Dysgonomonas sp.]
MDIDTLFNKRAYSVLHTLTPQEIENHCGWLGGEPPLIFENKEYRDKVGKKHLFYLTFILKDINKQISIFLPPFEVYLYSSQYPNIPILVIEHPLSLESSNIEELKMSEFNKHFIISKGEFSNEITTDEPYFIKLGGTPDLVQEEPSYYKELEKDNFNFLMQIEEFGYIDDSLIGSAPFCYGAFYIYGKIENENISDIIAGYWQSS